MAPEKPPGARTDRQSCRAKTRCTRGARYVTGADIARIARTLALEPWHFTDTPPASVEDPTGIVLDDGRRRVALRLANAAEGCVFLVWTPSGGTYCGLGDLAPISCRMFPADVHTDVPAACSRPECGCRAGADDEALAKDRRAWTADRDHWYQVVARWNALSARHGSRVTLADFQRYLLEAQYAREAGAEWPEEVSA